ncbi:MAG: hypothetical protein Q7S89_00530 [bacterium]|nr:hypothetical protein [bacterium]
MVGTQSATRTYPAVGVVFELTLDGDAPENDPIEMVRGDGYEQPEQWRHEGKRVAGRQTHRFKLVQVEPCRNIHQVRAELLAYGKIPEGQWREAFKAAYPTPDGNGPIGIADPSWLQGFQSFFPRITAGGSSRLDWAANGRDSDWRWLVEVSA